MQNRKKAVFKIEDAELADHAEGKNYAYSDARVAQALGLSKLGCRLVVLKPGKGAWPKHAHVNNDEMFVILSGSGRYHFGDEEIAVTAGDILGAPAGSMETAHQLIADEGNELRYLAISSMLEPDIGLYPDSGKFAVFAGMPPGGNAEARTFQHIGFLADKAGYWDGEDTG
ncbi:cupin domain-containing protein [Stappia sp. GBMRC 2046]|uniref:Cupin domain-containing protein n=1 Tax=Stappia sediminis TaxID=2692190 RepID=A0A7X3S6J9_9HYPH|nr:cupin domain-containing protein [Stappia sediminis]MXN63975.1 cupin domain-containing protein [Stappia sediminis]